MNCKLPVLLSSLLFLNLISSASALEANVPFTATIDDTCSVELQSPGKLARDGFYALDSAAPGGRAGVAAIYTTSSGFNVNLRNPKGFTTAPAGDVSATFTSEYRTTGGESTSSTSGETKTPLRMGVTNVIVDLRAVSERSIFHKGRYETFVTVVCE
ncbi:Spore coat protein U domain-containing protein [Nitratireductor aquimarinus]|uniref:hypothetical protein n=1 Tax=Nitratireductor aquimarinus TaxID=889300 RepID=UPI003B58C65B